jgi:chitinase
MPMVDYVNLMTYDLISGFSTVTGHHTALYGTPDQKESTDNCVRYLISNGVEPRKLIIGAAFYARIWEGVSPVRNGLYQSGKFKQSLGYSDFPKNLTEQQGYAFYWDSTAKAPFAYNAREKTFATYDDKRSIQEKSTYVATKGLGGIMFWHLGHDTPKNGLVEVMNSVLRPR